MQIAIELPNDFMAMQTEQQVRQEIRLSYALRLYKTATVTLAKAAGLAGLDIYDFMRFCKEDHIPVLDVTKEELEEELKSMLNQ